MFRAAWGPSRTACWAVAGIGRPVRGSGIEAQSPSAQTRSSPGTANVSSGRIQPRSSFAPGRSRRSGCGALPTVLTTVAVGISVPSSRRTRSSATVAIRRPRTIRTPAARSLRVA